MLRYPWYPWYAANLFRSLALCTWEVPHTPHSTQPPPLLFHAAEYRYGWTNTSPSLPCVTVFRVGGFTVGKGGQKLFAMPGRSCFWMRSSRGHRLGWRYQSLQSCLVATASTNQYSSPPLPPFPPFPPHKNIFHNINCWHLTAIPCMLFSVAIISTNNALWH